MGLTSDLLEFREELKYMRVSYGKTPKDKDERIIVAFALDAVAIAHVEETAAIQFYPVGTFQEHMDFIASSPLVAKAIFNYLCGKKLLRESQLLMDLDELDAAMQRYIQHLEKDDIYYKYKMADKFCEDFNRAVNDIDDVDVAFGTKELTASDIIFRGL